MMTAAATMTIITVITIVLQKLLPAEGFSYLRRIPWVMHQKEEEVMLEQFILHYIFGVFEVLFLIKHLFVPIGLFW